MKKNNSDEIIVKFDEVTKQYGDLVVLDKLNLDIKLDGKLVKKISFDRFNNKDNKFIDINLKQENLIKELHKVDFIINNPVSPLSLLESADGRELGILLESIEINHLN